MSKKLEGRVALVTGGGSGIGEAISQLLAEEGATTIISGRRQEPTQNLANRLKERDLLADYLVLDVSSEDEVARAVEKVNTKFGTIDLLVNNAGIINSELENTLDVTADMEKIMRINFFGTVYLTKYVVADLVAHKLPGTIVNIASICATQGCSGYSIYSASKGAMISYSKAIASDFARLGIRVNTVSPGVIHTPMSYVEMKDFDLRLDEFNKAHPLGRVGKPIDVARAVLYFSCNDSEWITGQNLIVDGGWLLRD